MARSFVGKLVFSFGCVAAASLVLGNGISNAGQTINEAGAFVCVNDKWDEKEPEKGHKLVDFAGRCVHVPDDPAAEKSTDDCVGTYEYMPDESWKGSGSCTMNFKDKSSITGNWEEGSHLKEYTWTVTGGTGKYNSASGDSTYAYDNLTDTLSGGRYKGTLKLP
jgi:hypothetical protein